MKYGDQHNSQQEDFTVSPPHRVTNSLLCASEATAVQPDPDPAAAALSRDLVEDGEVIILMLRPSLWYVLLASLGGLAFIAVVTFALAYMAKFMSSLPGIGWSDRQAFALGVAMSAIRVSWQMLEWMAKVYILTDRRVIVRSGVLRVSIFQAQLKNIQHTIVYQRLRERLLGLGTIGFATAGTDTLEAFWLMIRQPFQVHRTVVDAIKRYGK
jgi:Bacterial PH domain